MKQIEHLDEQELGELMTTLARRVEDGCAILGVEKPLFTLLLFNDPAVSQYISNCERDSMIAALRETADRLERRENVPRVAFPDRN